jgi:hypothetical protein
MLTVVIRRRLSKGKSRGYTVFAVGTHFSDALPKVLGYRSPFFRIKLKHKAHRLWQAYCTQEQLSS